MILKTVIASVLALLPGTVHAQEPIPPPPPPPAQGPTIELPQEVETPPPSTGQPLLGTGRRIPIGAYGEASLVFHGDEATASLDRFVLFFGHPFTDWVRFYAELEVEDAKEVEVEQAFLDFTPWRRVNVRAGLLLIPLGIINQLHEPPTFNGVKRPEVDLVIIPSTWRELGAGVFGEVVPGLHYQLYLVNGLDAAKISPDFGLAPARGNGLEVEHADAALTGRVNWDRWIGIDLGAGFYAGRAGHDDPSISNAWVALVEADARYKRRGLELRGEYARVFIGDAAQITALSRETNAIAPAVPSAMQGFYAEAGYDVLRLVHPGSTHEVVGFGRYEFVDTRASLPNVLAPGASEAQQYLTVGLTWRPHPQLDIKLDYRRTLAGESAMEGVEVEGDDRVSFGIGFMY